MAAVADVATASAGETLAKGHRHGLAMVDPYGVRACDGEAYRVAMGRLKAMRQRLQIRLNIRDTGERIRDKTLPQEKGMVDGRLRSVWLQSHRAYTLKKIALNGFLITQLCSPHAINALILMRKSLNADSKPFLGFYKKSETCGSLTDVDR